MANVSVSRIVNAPIEQVFKTWGDEFSDIYKFHPGLNKSYKMENSPSSTGKGALRRCELSDGKNWLNEKIVSYEPNKKIVVDIYESSMPLKAAKGIFSFRKKNANQTEVTFEMEYTPGMGFLGKLMTPMMNSQFKKTMQSLLDGNAAYVESGRQANATRIAA